MIIKDRFYSLACEEAKEDYFLMGIHRTDEDVEQRADSYRKNQINTGGDYAK